MPGGKLAHCGNLDQHKNIAIFENLKIKIKLTTSCCRMPTPINTGRKMTVPSCVFLCDVCNCIQIDRKESDV